MLKFGLVRARNIERNLVGHQVNTYLVQCAALVSGSESIGQEVLCTFALLAQYRLST
jgi:hypothetical protein